MWLLTPQAKLLKLGQKHPALKELGSLGSHRKNVVCFPRTSVHWKIWGNYFWYLESNAKFSYVSKDKAEDCKYKCMFSELGYACRPFAIGITIGLRSFFSRFSDFISIGIEGLINRRGHTKFLGLKEHWSIERDCLNFSHSYSAWSRDTE